MNQQKLEDEWSRQQRACAAAAKESADRGEHNYRRIYAAVAAAPMPALPRHMARRVLQRLVDAEEHAEFEQWLLRILTAGLGIAAALCVVRVPVLTWATIAQATGNFPWSLLLASAGAILAARVMDGFFDALTNRLRKL